MPSFLESNAEVIALGTPQGRSFKVGIAASVLQGVSAIGLIALSAWLISRAAEMPPILYLEMAIVGVRGFALGRAFFRYVERLTLHDSAFQMLTRLRPRVFARLVPLAPAGLGSANRTDTVNRLVNDVDEIQNLPLRVIAPLAQAFVVSVVTLICFSFVVPAAGLYLMATLLVSAGLAMPMSARMAREANQKESAFKSKLSVETMTFLENLDVLDAYGWDEKQLNRISKSQTDLLSISRIQAISAGLGSGLFSFLATVATLMCTYFAAVSVEQQKLPGVMLAVIALVPLAVYELLQSSQPALGAWDKYKASATRLVELLNKEIPAEVKTNAGQTELETFESLELSDVAIRYPEQVSPAISNVNLRLERGQILWIKGKSGRGKSTVASLLVGFLQPSSGVYLINGIPHEQYSTESIHRGIGLLEQEPTIFLGNLKANLLIAKPQATDAELWRVLERVGLSSTFLARDGLETQLGERGVAISGGEAQRVALARALLADFKVLIFDEPTANLDPETAAHLLADLIHLAKTEPDRATVFISHTAELEPHATNTVSV